MKVKNFFLKNKVFRREEFEDFLITISDAQVTSFQINRLLGYHVAVGNLVNIRRNLYASTITETDNNTWVNPYLIAGKSAKKAVLAYHTALEFFGAAYTTFEEMIYLSPVYTKPFLYQNILFKSIKPPVCLLGDDIYFSFVDEIKYEGVNIKVTSIERTIVDIFDKPNLAGGWEEIWRSLEVPPVFDVDKMIEYVLLIDNATTIAKVGYYLETISHDRYIDDKQLKKLENKISKSTHFIDKNKKSKLFKRWNLLVPIEIVDRAWEEPYEDDV